MLDVSPDEWDQLLIRGWRRFGPVYFRPACKGCTQCVSLRIPTAGFRPSRSQRRASKASSRYTAVVGPPRIDAERLNLYHAWHSSRERDRGWPASPIDAKEYFLQFAYPHACAREVAYYEQTPRGSRLVGIGICDESRLGWSAAYFFYSPDAAEHSLGTANVLFQIEWAQRRNIPHVYLGYCVSSCASLRYKANFRPHEILVGRPGIGEEPRWMGDGSTHQR